MVTAIFKLIWNTREEREKNPQAMIAAYSIVTKALVRIVQIPYSMWLQYDVTERLWSKRKSLSWKIWINLNLVVKCKGKIRIKKLFKIQN